MVRVDIMDMIDHRMQIARGNNRPFGGCQVIAFGDLFQLPPVVKEVDVEKFLNKRYGTVYFFGAPACREDKFVYVELTKVFRQKEQSFAELLNNIRTGTVSWDEIQTLNARNVLPPSDDEIITLTLTNDAAQKINESKLHEILFDEYQYTGTIEGTFCEDDMPTSLVLTLKVGAQVMMLRNDPSRRWVNGTLGRIASLSDDLISVEISGQTYSVDKETWDKYEYEYDPEEQSITHQIVGTFTQYPLRLAYAITIHKSQGQTFDSVIIDYSEASAFAPGQTYVALSRCRSFDTLYLTSTLSLQDVRVNQEIINYINKRKNEQKGIAEMIGKNIQIMHGQKFSDSSAALPKHIRAKIETTINQLLKNPESPGLHVEKIGDNRMFSARIDDSYRIIFSVSEDNTVLYLLYAGNHEDAYRFAEKYIIEVNAATGGIQLVEKAPDRMISQPGSPKKLSRLATVTDAQFVEMGVPEEYWQQLREKIFMARQLIGFRNLFSQEAYETLEFILDGTPVDEAMELFDTMNATVIPIPPETKEREPMFAQFTPEQLLSVGIPNDNINKVLRIKTEKELEIIAASLPILAQQALYALKSGETIEDIIKMNYPSAKPNLEGNLDVALKSPITLSEFAPIDSEQALKAILEYPNEKWRVFLHPTQYDIIQQDYNGPARIVGGAGTGKTVVIVHRAKRLASECSTGEKILVTTFGNTLKHDIDERIQTICSEEELEHIVVRTVDKLSYDLSKQFLGKKVIYSGGKGLKLLDVWNQAMNELGMPNIFDAAFCVDEWCSVIQAQNISSMNSYLTAQRYGRGKQFDKNSREKFWKLSERYKSICNVKGVIDVDWAQNLLVEKINNTQSSHYKSVIVDECQDLHTPALRMLRALAGSQRKNDMYLSGDSRQRIYGGQVSLSQCGIVINNRSRVLKLNYRTTDEIYSFAMQLQKDYQYDDMDGKSMSKDKSTCIFHGPLPSVRRFNSAEEEVQEMIRSIRNLISSGVLSTEICIMVRSTALLKTIRNRLEMNGLQVLEVTANQPDDKSIPGARVMTMHRGKGMEFTYVYLPCLCKDIIPRKSDLEKVEDDEMLGEIYLSEANLLSVAITRAKHYVWLSYSDQPSDLIKRYIV